MKTIPLKIETHGRKGHPSIALISTIDRNVSVNVEERFSRDERILKSAKAQLSANWREYFFGELIGSIQREERRLLNQMISYQAYQQIGESFKNIMASFPEFIDAESIKTLDNPKNLGEGLKP